MIRILRILLAIIFVLTGLLVILQASDLNPLLLISPYREWLNQIIAGHGLGMFFIWIVICILLGSTIIAIGAKISNMKIDLRES